MGPVQKPDSGFDRVGADMQCRVLGVRTQHGVFKVRLVDSVLSWGFSTVSVRSSVGAQRCGNGIPRRKGRATKTVCARVHVRVYVHVCACMCVHMWGGSRRSDGFSVPRGVCVCV